MPAFDLPPIHLPFDSRINPYQDVASQGANNWLESMGLVDSQARHAFESARFFELASRAYPEVQARELDLLAFAEVRRYTGATQLMFSAGESAGHAELPEAFCHSWPFQVLRDTASDVVVLVNDLLSYGKETHYDEISNYVVVCQHHLGLSLREAMAFVNNLLNSRVHAFEQARERLPLFIERQQYPHAQRIAIERYIRLLESWMSGNLDWSLRAPRYIDSHTWQGGNR